MKNNFNKKLFMTLFAVFNIANSAFAEVANKTVPSSPEVKALIAKFIVVMIGLLAFSFILYLGLSIYNKFFVDMQIKDANLRKFSLKSPKDFDEAIMMFIEKNRLQ